MNIIAVDDEQLALCDLADAVGEAVPGCTLHLFRSGGEALEFAAAHPVDIALLDIEMPGIDGIALAKHLKELQKTLNIIFVTGYSDYMMDAFALHASGYLLKPVLPAAIQTELHNLRFPPPVERKKAIRAQCFGNFEVYAHGKPLEFNRKKTKELFAYLVSRRGAACGNRELAAILWEDQADSQSAQSNFRNLVADLMAVLRANRAEDVIQRSFGSLAVVPDLLDCDYYDFFRGDVRAVNSYEGEFMAQYSWAEFTVGYLNRLL